MESNKTLSARVAAILGGLVLSAILGLFGVVWNDGRINERWRTDSEHTDERVARVESDFREFRRRGDEAINFKVRELRNEFIECRNRIENELATIRVGPSRYAAQGGQIKESLNDFREVQKDVLHRLRMAESTLSILMASRKKAWNVGDLEE